MRALLAVHVYARYTRRLRGGWRTAYVVSSIAALYLNVFVGVVQAFRHVPVLHALAPTESELPFVVAQGAMLLAFVALGRACVIGFRRHGSGDPPTAGVSRLPSVPA
jgi:hypothetical protein